MPTLNYILDFGSTFGRKKINRLINEIKQELQYEVIKFRKCFILERKILNQREPKSRIYIIKHKLRLLNAL